MFLLLPLALLLLQASAPATPIVVAPAAEQDPSSTSPPLPVIEEHLDVVGVTPLHGIGLPRARVPSNVQVIDGNRIDTAVMQDVASVLADRAASLHISETQGGTFQPDVLFRGFGASPLLGASEGLAVYQDGVRVNEGFGDTIHWDVLPTEAIASINLSPGSNPLFGLNALGGALSFRTHDGFGSPRGRALVTTGSFGRRRVEGAAGGHGDTLGYFVAGTLTDEGGWRDFSPSTVRRIFGDVAWRGAASRLNLSLTAASNDLTGNGAAPALLLEDDRRAVFTYPDRTDHDMALLTLKGQRQTATGLFNGVAYYRHNRIGTFNGDAADDDDDDDDDGHDDDDDDGPFGEVGPFEGVNNRSLTRGRAAGVTGQFTGTRPLWGRDNHFVAGAGADIAWSRFGFSAEWARLTPERGTIGTGFYDDEAEVSLRSGTTTSSAFATNTWSATPALGLVAAARVNWTGVRLRDQLGTALSGDHTFWRLNPAVGLTYQLTGALNAYGSYTQSSRVPTPVELTCADPEDPCRLPNAFVSDPPLEQVVAGTWEAGLRRMAGRATWNVAAFSSRASDDIIFVSSGTLRGEGHFENVERTWRRGIETSVDLALLPRFSAYGTYTLQRASYGTDLRLASPFHPLAENTEIVVPSGSRLPGVPTHSGKAGLAVALARLTVGMSLRAQSGQFLRGDESNQLAALPGFAIVGVHARQRLAERLSVVGQVQNLFDARYSTFGVLGEAELLGEAFDDQPRFYSPGPPRAVWVGLEVRF